MTTAGLLLAGDLLYAWHVLVPSTGWIAFFSTTPWLFVVVRRREWSYLRVTWVFGLTFYFLALIATPWLRSFTTLGWVVAPLFYVPFFVLAPLVTHSLLRSYRTAPLLVMWPLAFTASEWLRIRMSPGELPLAQLGTGLVSHETLTQIADVTGVAGLTALACMTAAVTATAAHAVLRSDREPSELRKLRVQALTVTLAITTVWAYGKVRESQSHVRRGPTVLAVQHNFHGWWNPADAALQHSELVRLTEIGAAGRQVDIVVWPENTVRNLAEGGLQVVRIEELARRLQTTILADGPSTNSQGLTHHTTALMSGGSVQARYDKVALVPWSEYVPLVPALRSLSPSSAEAFRRLVRSTNPHLMEMTRGDRVHTLDFQARDGLHYAVATPICYESLSSRLMAAFFSAGRAEHAGAFVLNPVSERLLGNTIHEQTLALTRLRAIENRVTIIRASNNGISAAVDPSGRPYAWVRDSSGGYAVDRPGFFVAPVLLDSRFGTVYSRLGDWLPIVFVVCVVAWLVDGHRRRLRSHRGPDPASSVGDAHPS